MENVTLLTAAKWELVTGILGAYTTPLLLNITIKNNRSSNVKIKRIGISIKSFIWSTEILGADKDDIIEAKSKFGFDLDVRYILNKYSETKEFTVKVKFENGETLESSILTVKMLTEQQSRFI